jgi:hypothetical protein
MWHPVASLAVLYSLTLLLPIDWKAFLLPFVETTE